MSKHHSLTVSKSKGGIIQSQTSLHPDPLICLEGVFKSADEDNDGLLNKKEYTKFVQMGYNKQCPEGMYENVCARFQSNPQLGVNWTAAKAIHILANNYNKKRKTNSNSLSHLNCVITDKISEYKLIHRTSTLSSIDLHALDTSSMIFDVLDNQNKSLQNKLTKERNKRKKTEEKNDEYQLQINTLKKKNIQIKNKYKLANKRNVKLASNINEHFNSKEKQIKKELRDSPLTLAFSAIFDFIS